MLESRPLVLIPSYNTGVLLPKTVQGALEQGVPVMVVIDGSTDGSPALLEPLLSHPGLQVLRLEKNVGKGSAVREGTRRALEQSYTHVMCMDADGQHPAEWLPQYFALSSRHPEAAVFGRPIFDATAPALRVNGRKVSNFWANLETLGWGIDDSLFGMRLYPAAQLLEVFESTPFARRFDFDPEVAVRLAWAGVPILNLPTPVKYIAKEDGGVSQFRYVRDNALLSWMHLRLLCGFALRLPWLLLRGGNPLLHLNPSTP
jgi:glycosyltransferase involved in cell wall biosynthesis